MGSIFSARFFLIRSELILGHDLRTEVTDRIQDPRGLAGHNRSAGSLLSIASADTERVATTVMITVFPVAEFASIVYVTTMLTRTHWILGVAILMGAPLLIMVAMLFGTPLQKRSGHRQAAVADAAATATDVVQGLRIIKGLGAVTTVRQRYKVASDEAFRRTISANSAEARLNGATELTGMLLTTSLGVVSGFMAINGVISIGEVIIVVGLTQFIITPMTMFGRNLVSKWASAKASGARIQEVLRAGYIRELTTDSNDVVERIPLGISVIENKLSSAERDRWETLDRCRVIVAPHQASLFDGTIAENIAAFSTQHSSTEITQALYAASGTDIPGGDQREVGEEGRLLSGGQRQRVALARALAADPDVLMLIDPTTAVDSVTESQIAQRVAQLRIGKRTVVVSDAPSWRIVADRVVTVDQAQSWLVGSYE
ncbi:ABC transporter transmembrane domain-containing protein [Corynebacterium kutscheri]|uniref:ABC-type multidrug/protein/lipid transport system, ATPase component n=1 Tax=Corynebacterium kutscheri TaxID=35755 RepID=A0AB38VUI3_9CORY|nr:ABC transporter ATP-binding protein [Corynebacterium kutscheri]VEH07073.1 ABC-type multidrug/protein/lipid transport system, ATPase component [Corynebacterium kutscheri]